MTSYLTSLIEDYRNQLVQIPKEVGFVNELLTKKALRNVIGNVLEICGVAATVHFLDAIKTTGFNMAFKGGLSFNLGDVIVPEEKETSSM